MDKEKILSKRLSKFRRCLRSKRVSLLSFFILFSSLCLLLFSPWISSAKFSSEFSTESCTDPDYKDRSFLEIKFNKEIYTESMAAQRCYFLLEKFSQRSMIVVVKSYKRAKSI